MSDAYLGRTPLAWLVLAGVGRRLTAQALQHREPQRRYPILLTVLARCTLADRIAELLIDGTGHINPSLVPLVEQLNGMDKPLSGLTHSPPAAERRLTCSAAWSARRSR